MNKKTLLLLIIIIAVLSLLCVHSVTDSKENFEGLFSMNVPAGQHFKDTAYCRPNGGLGCAKEFWEVNAGCYIEDNDIVIYYYDESYLVEGESDALQHALNTLTTSYLYEPYELDGNIMVLTNDLGSKNIPSYIVGVANDDNSEVVFVGGYHLNKLKNYANSIEFL